MEPITAHWDRPPTTILPPNEVQEAFEGAFMPATDAATNLIRSEIIPFTPHFLGALRNSIHTRKASVSGGTITGKVTTSSPYALPVEDGSRPHWPPLEPLIYWVARKFGGAGSAISDRSIGEARGLRRSGFRRVRSRDIKQGIIEDIARRIQYKIAKRGTKAHHMFERGFDKAEPDVLKIFDDANVRFVERLGQ